LIYFQHPDEKIWCQVIFVKECTIHVAHQVCRYAWWYAKHYASESGGLNSCVTSCHGEWRSHAASNLIRSPCEEYFALMGSNISSWPLASIAIRGRRIYVVTSIGENVVGAVYQLNGNDLSSERLKVGVVQVFCVNIATHSLVKCNGQILRVSGISLVEECGTMDRNQNKSTGDGNGGRS